jgi:allophanate hydrolase subunit 1
VTARLATGRNDPLLHVGELRLIAAGDAMLVVELGSQIDPAINERPINLAAAVDRPRLAGVRDVVPTYRSVGVLLRPVGSDIRRVERGGASTR